MSSIQPLSRHAWEQREFARERENFAGHQIVERGLSLWRLRNPMSSNLWCDVQFLHGSTVYIGGDVDAVGFCGGDGTDRDRVRWVGTHGHDLEYFVAKAARWFGDSEPFETVAAEVALGHLDWQIERLAADAEAGDEVNSDEVSAIREARDALLGMEFLSTVLDDLSDAPGWDSEMLHNLGRVTAPRVIRFSSRGNPALQDREETILTGYVRSGGCAHSTTSRAMRRVGAC